MRENMKKSLSINDAAALLLRLHGGIFGDKPLMTNVRLSQIHLNSEAELARALWEWLYFGLYVFVEGIQDNFPNSDNVGIGVAIARAFLAEFEGHLQQTGIKDAELALKRREVDERIRTYLSVAASDGPERVGFAVAGLVFGLSGSSGKVPESLNTYEFSLLANKAHIGGLKSVNDFFQEYTAGLGM